MKNLVFDIQGETRDVFKLPISDIGTYPVRGNTAENYIGSILDWIRDTIDYDFDNPTNYSVLRSGNTIIVVYAAIPEEEEPERTTIIKNFRWE